MALDAARKFMAAGFTLWPKAWRDEDGVYRAAIIVRTPSGDAVQLTQAEAADLSHLLDYTAVQATARLHQLAADPDEGDLAHQPQQGRA